MRLTALAAFLCFSVPERSGARKQRQFDALSEAGTLIDAWSLGRELATAQRSLETGEPYIQDRAPGEPMAVKASVQDDSCGPTCTAYH